ncbi:unnamed protein product [Ilex paraguariensis]|uniref:Uncharacterized protein n=1 Tax=Ilex paraguariensis TaxID=185542 RepID=A0ABC8T8V0_9AQUA
MLRLDKEENFTGDASLLAQEIEPGGEVLHDNESAEAQREISFKQNENYDATHKDDGMTAVDSTDSGLQCTASLSQELEVLVGTKECTMEKKTAVEEEQELQDGKLESHELELPIGKNEKINPSFDSGEAVEDLFAPPASAKQAEEAEVSPMSPTASQVSLGSELMVENDRKLIEENDKLREMVEKLIEAGKQQLTAISKLSGRVENLEKRLSKQKKLKMRRHKVPLSRARIGKHARSPAYLQLAKGAEDHP